MACHINPSVDPQSDFTTEYPAPQNNSSAGGDSKKSKNM